MKYLTNQAYFLQKLANCFSIVLLTLTLDNGCDRSVEHTLILVEGEWFMNHHSYGIN